MLAKANATITQVEIYVRNDRKLATNKKLTERMSRVKNLLASAPGTLAPEAVHAPGK
ncbi:hypothetical protein GO755_22450 [Spirosoma sp. HMF4905]|uniref:Uncharacterized protein n=1 Tax=Spirosoma arboris TaxID=2682092 RepID=A0A7K1SG75_9BACT|nr:hypothetical protein [Spirosoma arboris]MVM32819.1 hypothetical protein [Spirosoma arboris]